MTEHAGAVLVVDDEAAIRDVAHRVLTSAGYRVTTAANGQEALRLLRDPATPADLVLTDVVMPGMTGKAFAAQAQQIRPGIRMMFMSGYEQQAISTESWPEPGTQVIAKPFSRAALLARVTQALAADIGTADTGGPGTSPASTSRIPMNNGHRLVEPVVGRTHHYANHDLAVGDPLPVHLRRSRARKTVR